MVFSLNQKLNVSPNLQIAICLKISRAYLTSFSMMLKSMSFPLTVPNRTSNVGEDFSLQSLEFYSCIQFEIRKDWSVDFAKLSSRESDSVYNHVS